MSAAGPHRANSEIREHHRRPRAASRCAASAPVCGRLAGMDPEWLTRQIKMLEEHFAKGEHRIGETAGT
jgi:hypothetical protein